MTFFTCRMRRAAGLPPRLASRAMSWLAGVLLPIVCVWTANSQDVSLATNAQGIYQALRALTLSGEAVSVTNFSLKRDTGTFHLKSGTVCFVAPVQGKVTGAVFAGDGEFILDVPPSEREMLKLLTKENEFSENFSQMVLRFTDSTYDDIKKAGKRATEGCEAGPLKETQHTTRHKFKDNLEVRLLADVLSAEPGGFFLAFIRGKRYSDKELFTIDPHESREQVSFVTYEDNKSGEWASFALSGERGKSAIGHPVRIEHQQLETTLEKSAHLDGKATTDLVALRNGVRVVPFDLFHTLRVQSVTSNGQPLSFIQEDKNEDANFAVILPKAVNAGDKFTIITTYDGKDAVTNEGGGNYFPVSRVNWYPNEPGTSFGEYVATT